MHLLDGKVWEKMHSCFLFCSPSFSCCSLKDFIIHFWFSLYYDCYYLVGTGCVPQYLNKTQTFVHKGLWGLHLSLCLSWADNEDYFSRFTQVWNWSQESGGDGYLTCAILFHTWHSRLVRDVYPTRFCRTRLSKYALILPSLMKMLQVMLHSPGIRFEMWTFKH